TEAKAYYDFDKMLSAEDFDVLHICTPHYLHFPMAMAALDAGKHVFCEKPLSIKYEDANALARKAKEKGLYLGVCFQNRYNASSIYIKNMINSGKLGKIKGAKGVVTWNRGAGYFADDWHGTLEKEGGGVLINQSIHTLDLCQWFIGSKAAGVKGMISTDRFDGVIETEDTAHAHITFENGAELIFYATIAYAENSPIVIEVIGEKGKITLTDKIIVKIDGESEQILDVKMPTGEKAYWGAGHDAAIADFYAAIKEKRPFAIDGDAGKIAVDLVEKIYKSARL
ncbi:MAG: Gfo/Idh/MocA family oxidoreductase, partial [Oscillospiraceae bacterium]|nr:Gfo/Idh/MocA family oxidoreductase [Oscillospiraceae bacterium]